MWLYLTIFFIPLIFYLNGGADNRNKTFLACFITFLAFFVGLTDMFGGYDRYIYSEVFDNIADDVTVNKRIGDIDMMSYFEFGYSMMEYAIAQITTNRYINILIITLIIYFNLYKSISRHINNYPFALIIFFGMTFFFTFTYLRQITGCTIAWLGIKYLLNGDKKWFFFIVLITALMHKSGLVFALIYFIPIKKWGKRQIVITLLMALIIGASGIASTFYDLYIETLDFIPDNVYTKVQSTRYAYVLEVLFFAWYILTHYDKIEANRQNLIFLNMSWAFCLMLLLFVRSENGGRMSWYFSFGIVYIVTLITTSLKDTQLQNKTKFYKYLIVIVMLGLYVRVYSEWQILQTLYPYKTFLTNGVREHDGYWIKYEYDHDYDNDKFYRPAFRFLGE